MVVLSVIERVKLLGCNLGDSLRRPGNGLANVMRRTLQSPLWLVQKVAIGRGRLVSIILPVARQCLSAPSLRYWRLSCKQGEHFLVSLASPGVAQDRMSIEGRAARDPIADNGTAEGRAANRRGELYL